MALEINEIGIRMRVRDGGEGQQRDAQPAPSRHYDENYEEIVEDCVRRVLRVLKTMQER